MAIIKVMAKTVSANRGSGEGDLVCNYKKLSGNKPNNLWGNMPVNRTVKSFLAILLGFLVGILFVPVHAGAQQADAPAEENSTQARDEETQAGDVLGRSTPQGTVIGFLTSVDVNNYDRAAQYLDLRNISHEAEDLGAQELAKRLEIVLERSGWIDVDSLSRNPQGMKGDSLPNYRDVLSNIRHDDQEYVLLLQRIPHGESQFIWKISNATVSRIPELYSIFGYGVVIETIAESVPETSFLGIDLFKWIIIFGAGLISAPFVVGFAWFLGRHIPIKEPKIREKVTRFLTRPVSVLVVALIMRWTAKYLGIGVTGQKIMASGTLITILAIWVLIKLIDVSREIYSLKLSAKGRPGAAMLIKPLSTAIKVIVIILAFILWLDNIGVNITTLLAGLGVGGIAIALALQRPAEDFLAAISLFTQQQVKVGDFCRFGDQLGTIEEIGLRTTRLRTLSNTVVSLPNARFAAEYIENISVREKILYNPTIRIDYETPRKVIEAVLANIRKMLKEDKMISQTDLRVRFREISNTSHDIEIFAYIKKTDWDEFLEVSEGLNLKVLDAIEAAGTSLAVPIQKIMMDAVGSDKKIFSR